MSEDIYNRSQKLQRALKDLEDMYSNHNYQLLMQYKRKMQEKGLSVHTIAKFFTSIKSLAPYINFDLDEVTVDNRRPLQELVIKINRDEIERRDGKDKPHSTATLSDYKKALKQFYKWEKDSERPAVCQGFTCTVPKKKRNYNSPDEIPQPEHVDEFIENCCNLRDRALIALLWDTGARIGEILTLSWQDINIMQYKAMIKIQESKELTRPVPVFHRKYVDLHFRSFELLKKWRQEHPNPGPSQPVFCLLQGENKGTMMNHSNAYQQISTAATRSDVELYIKHNPHIFRAARSTYLGEQGAPQQIVEKFQGFVKNSKQLERYMRLHSGTVDNFFENIRNQNRREVQGMAS
jgi:integrase